MTFRSIDFQNYLTMDIDSKQVKDISLCPQITPTLSSIVILSTAKVSPLKDKESIFVASEQGLDASV